MRGLPGSGKSTLARQLLENNNGHGIILSTDDFFINSENKYEFDPSKIGNAHAVCHGLVSVSGGITLLWMPFSGISNGRMSSSKQACLWSSSTTPIHSAGR